MTTPPYEDIPAWPPARWTPPLSPEFPSAFDSYRDLLRMVWMAAFGYMLEIWQETAIRHALELFPEGHPRAGQLRFRQVVISLGRQNGKTEIAAAIGLIALLMRARPQVVGLATSADQARLVYKRTMQAIAGTPRLRMLFKALTETRGIQTTDGGSYEIKAAKSAALQGIPIDVGLVDELHILAMALWFDLVNGLGGRPNCLVIGITTAGDDDSELLLHLYTEGEAAINAGSSARFCFLVWEALEAARPESDYELGRELARANPSIASGRVDLENAIIEVRSMPEPDAVRYRLNRFSKATGSFITRAEWDSNRSTEPWPEGAVPVFTIDRTPDWGYATIGVFARMPDGKIYVDVAASLVKPTLSQLVELCTQLNAFAPHTFGMDSFTLRDLGKELEMRGLPVTLTGYADMLNASALFYAKVTQQQLAHPGNDLLGNQIVVTKRVNSGDGFKISRKESSASIDGVISHVLGVQLVETMRNTELQIF